MLIKKWIWIVAMDLRLSFSTVNFWAQSQLDVRIVEAALITACEIVCFDQVYVQIRFIKVVSQSQMKSPQMLSFLAKKYIYIYIYKTVQDYQRNFLNRILLSTCEH
ncbi:hypothetical protein PUN28_012941 [Cardiocondyla obscurior]|uniref:Secreted protein n=1 Tax=Cardiocondyla obscurior TaxID=286306 RepID=A0AAW2F851_9HYME